MILVPSLKEGWSRELHEGIGELAPRLKANSVSWLSSRRVDPKRSCGSGLLNHLVFFFSLFSTPTIRDFNLLFRLFTFLRSVPYK